MDSRIFSDFPMGLDEDLLKVPMENRLYYQPESNELFINLENYAIRCKEDIEALYANVENACASLEKPVYCVVNYDNFVTVSHFIDHYLDMIRYFKQNYFTQMNGYTTSAFLRTQINNTLGKQKEALNLFDSLQAAEQALKD